MRELWQKINFTLCKSLKRGDSEELYEREVIHSLEKLGWDEHLGEIDASKQASQLGSTNTIRPDIIISLPNKEALFVIEVKKPAVDIEHKPHANQLFSYMRQLKCAYGLLIGNKIQIYYDGALKKHGPPVLLRSIDLSAEDSAENADGLLFVELFCKGKFSVHNLEEFAKQTFAENKLEQLLFSDDYKQTMQQLVVRDLEEKWDKATVNNVLSRLQLSVLVKRKNAIEKSFNSSKFAENLKSQKRIDNSKTTKPRDKMKYRFNGETHFKNRLVLAVIKYFVKVHPNLSYAKLLEKFPKELQGSHGVFSEVKHIKEKYAGQPKKRHFLKDDELIALSDCQITVCTQWGSGKVRNIEKFIAQAQQYGYEIKPVPVLK